MLYGVDVSHWNGTIDFAKVSKHIDFLITKATQGTMFFDDCCFVNISNCQEFSILPGVYHYVTNEDPIAQADNFIKVYKDCTNMAEHIIPAFDIEDSKLTMMHWRDVTELVEELVAEFYDKTHVYPLLYTSTYFMKNNMFESLGKLCGGWIARYGNLSPKRKDLNLTIHQYSSTGMVDGIKGNVDLDRAYLTHEAWARIAKGDN